VTTWVAEEAVKKFGLSYGPRRKPRWWLGERIGRWWKK